MPPDQLAVGVVAQRGGEGDVEAGPAETDRDVHRAAAGVLVPRAVGTLDDIDE